MDSFAADGHCIQPRFIRVRVGGVPHIGSAIQVQNLSKIYGKDSQGRNVGLIDLTLDVPEGQIFGLVGPNGSGKTTTLKLLLGLIFPTSGSGSVFGMPLGTPEVKERIGFLPEGPYFYDHLNASELLRFYGGLFGMGGSSLEARIEELLHTVTMWDRRDIRVRNYSRGMLQRIGVAQAMLNDPDLVFLDEPTSGLDPLGAKQMRDIIIRLRDQGKSVFLCSHLLKEMEPLCDHIAILNRGRVVSSGAITDLLAGPQGGYRIEAHGVSAEIAQKVGALAASTGTLDAEFLAKFSSQQVALEAAGILEAGGANIEHLGPDRRSLEEVFIEAVEEGEP